MTEDRGQLKQYLSQWQLTAISQPFLTATSLLQKVRDPQGDIGMLKLTGDCDERRGIAQLYTWSMAGNPAAVRVLKADKQAILLDYAKEHRSLLPEALNEATHLQATKKLANTVWQLHQTPLDQFTNLRALAVVFESLMTVEHNSLWLQKAQKIAQALLDSTTSDVPLHGDAHHDNMLYFTKREIRAIDPKGFHGEHYFDYLPLFINPDLGAIRMNPHLFEEKLTLLCHAGNGYLLQRSRLIQWIFVGAALSATWFLEDDMPVEAAQQLALLPVINIFLSA